MISLIKPTAARAKPSARKRIANCPQTLSKFREPFPSLEGDGPIEALTRVSTDEPQTFFPSLEGDGPIEANTRSRTPSRLASPFRRWKATAPLKRIKPNANRLPPATFRRWKATAPLKLQAGPGLRSPDRAFRRWKATAPLKRDGDSAVFAGGACFPSLEGDGPIEAAGNAAEYFTAASPFRRWKATAPLKPLGDSRNLGALLCVFPSLEGDGPIEAWSAIGTAARDSQLSVAGRRRPH